MSREAVAETLSHYPLKVTLEGQLYTIRQMTADDGPALMRFAQDLPPHDTLYMRRDITRLT